VTPTPAGIMRSSTHKYPINKDEVTISPESQNLKTYFEKMGSKTGGITAMDSMKWK
jgi:hypothetical protein